MSPYTLPKIPLLSMPPNLNEADAPRSTTAEFHNADESATNEFNDATLDAHESAADATESATYDITESSAEFATTTFDAAPSIRYQ